MSERHLAGDGYGNRLLRRCIVDAVLPQSLSFTLVDVISLVENDDGNAIGSTAINLISQRTDLYLDESITAFVILRCTYPREDNLKAFISRLKIKLDAYAVTDGARDDRRSQSTAAGGKELVDSAFIDDTDDPEVMLEGDDGSDTSDNEQESPSGKRVYLLWRKQLHIARTRIRIPLSHLYLSAICTLESTSDTPTRSSFHTPPTPNLLAPLSFSTPFTATSANTPSNKTAPILPAARLHKHIPTDALQPPQPTTLKSANRKLFSLKPALSARLKCETIGGSPNTKRMLIALDLEAAQGITPSTDSGQGAEVRVHVENIDIALAEGSSEFVSGSEMAMPLRLCAGDASTMLYELHLSPLKVRRRLEGLDALGAGARGNTAHVLSVRISATVCDSPSGEDESESDEGRAQRLERRILIQFRTTLDLSPLHHRLSCQIRPRNSEVAVVERQVKLFVTTLPSSGRPGSCRWQVSLENLSDRTRSLRIKPLMVHEAAHAMDDIREGPALIPMTPILDFGDLSGDGGSATKVLEWSTVNAALSKSSGAVRISQGQSLILARVGGLRCTDVGIDIPPDKLPDVYIEA